jgi:hypothetical protein
LLPKRRFWTAGDLSVPAGGERQGQPTKDRRVSPDVLVIEACGPGIKAGGGKFIVFGGRSSEAREVPTVAMATLSPRAPV